jgi:hypothetical protein
MERLTGAAVRVRSGRIEVSFAGETELEEILEGLEAALGVSTTMAVRAGD